MVATGDPWEPYRLVDPDGELVVSVRSYLTDLQAAGRAVATQRSYGMDLLRWFRFLWAVEVCWDRASRVEARDFLRWMLVADKPARGHWRGEPSTAPRLTMPVKADRDRPGPGAAGGKRPSGRKYAPATRAHNESVLRHFYDFHLEAGTGPLVNPFPLDRERRRRRAHAHHNPMEPYEPKRSG